jgi:transcriptional regulator with PAS, ATPase and Fis domain
MVSLSYIAEDLIRFAHTIKSILGAEVLIVDEHLVRLVSTETSKQYAKIDAHSVFASALKENQAFLIDEPRIDQRCLSCSDRESCTEFALACVPITLKDRTVGVIGLIAFTASERDSLLIKRDELLNFLHHIALLIAIQLEEKEKNQFIEMMASELHLIFDAIEKPMMTCNEDGQVVRHNKACLQYFGSDTNMQKGAVQLSQITAKNKTVSAHKHMRYTIDQDGSHLTGTFKRYDVCGSQKTHYVFLLEDSKAILGMYRAVVTDASTFKLSELIGNHPLFLNAIERANRSAQTDLSVMLLGESGTGKELFARGIHSASERALFPFIAINCAAIPESLLEAELFGYDEGAFTGAVKGGRSGKFELAHGGTLFLDEIGDMPLSLQAKLLRVLQDGYITRVGAHYGTHVNVRIITATHQDLQSKMQVGTFRKDLYYRISTYPIELPALRARKTDIPQLVQYFIQKYQGKGQSSPIEISSDAMALLVKHTWDGNVRELENTIAYALSFGSFQGIEAMHLPQHLGKLNDREDQPLSKQEKFQDAVKRYGTSVEGLEKIQKELHLSRATVYRRLKNLN